MHAVNEGMKEKWTCEEADIEVAYRRSEREGILCDGADPTPEQKKVAREEALAWLTTVEVE